MRPHDELRNDDDLREIFREMRREDETAVPPWVSPRRVQAGPVLRGARLWRLALATAAPAILAAVIAGLAIDRGPSVPRTPPGTYGLAGKYVPPPPSATPAPADSIARASESEKLGKKQPAARTNEKEKLLSVLGYIGGEPTARSLPERRHEGPEMAPRAPELAGGGESAQAISGRLVTRVLTLHPASERQDVIARGHESPTAGSESYAAVEDNPFHVVADEPLSTFSADVDTASYSNVRRFLTEGRLPPRDAVRVEELVNYFDYDHPAPRGDAPFGVAVETAGCPWNPDHRLARITLAARREARADYPGSNLVFLIDVSGSMRAVNKLPLVKTALAMLADQLDGRDTVSIVVYAGASGLVLPPTPGSDRAAIRDALGRLEAGGGTAGAAGLELAYRTARENFVAGGVNRLILATDGDFNVGPTSHSELMRIIGDDARRGIFLTALGFGMGNFKDDRLEQLADRGNGNYAYIDGPDEARKVLVEEIGGTLVTVAKDVKLQVEFNPLRVGAYRLIGYENRLLAHRDFDDDTKDAGEIGAGHTVTVLYELIPPGAPGTEPEVAPLRYQRNGGTTEDAGGDEIFTLKIRFKRPDADTSTLLTYPVRDAGLTLGTASDDFRFAAAVAAFGMRLRRSPSVAGFGWEEIARLASGAVGADEHGHRAAFPDLVRRAGGLAPDEP